MKADSVTKGASKANQKSKDPSTFFVTAVNQQDKLGDKQGSSQNLKNSNKNIEESAFDIDLDKPYEDDDFQIYFDKGGLLEHLSNLEEDNLFRIHLVQDEEQSLEKYKKASELRVQQKLNEIAEVNKNIEQLQSSLKVAYNKSVFLESNMRVK